MSCLGLLEGILGKPLQKQYAGEKKREKRVHGYDDCFHRRLAFNDYNEYKTVQLDRGN